MAQCTQTPPREPREPARLTRILARDNGSVKEPASGGTKAAAPTLEPQGAAIGSGGPGPGLCPDRERPR